MIDPKDKELVYTSLQSLVDHFEKKGINFMCAYQFTDDSRENSLYTYNFMATTSPPEDRAHAVVAWAGIVDEGFFEANKPG